MNIVSVDAVSVTVSTGREGRHLPDQVQGPVIVLDFPLPMAVDVANRVMLHAKEEHVYAGYYRHADRQMTLGCYVVVPINGLTYVIGSERNMLDDEWQKFRERLGEFGSFTVLVGIASDDPTGTYLVSAEHPLRVTKFYDEDVKFLVVARIGLA